MSVKQPDHTAAFCERFNQVLDAQGIAPRNQGRIQLVAEMFMVSHAGAGKWVNGASLPCKSRRREIAERLNVPYEWLEFGRGSMEGLAPEQAPANMLPVLNFSQAVEYQSVLNSYSGETVVIDAQLGPDAFVIYNQGTAMSGRFPEGTLLVFDPERKAIDGDYVLAKTGPLPDAVFRQLVMSDSGKYLYAQDPRFQTYKMKSGDRLIAKMVQARMSFD